LKTGLLKTEEAARWLGYAEKSLRNMRSLGRGPKATVLPSGGIRYALADLREWAASRD
jgi:hypothetical protein